MLRGAIFSERRRIVGHVRIRAPIGAIRPRATRKRSLSEAQVNANHNRSKIRARVEHVFAAQQTALGGRIVRTSGIVRARAKLDLQNLAYNIRRLVTLKRIAAA